MQEKVLLGYTDAVDSWAVGILAYELLVGRPPFEKESRDDTYQLIMHEEPNLPPWLSVGARDFIASALAKVEVLDTLSDTAASYGHADAHIVPPRDSALVGCG